MGDTKLKPIKVMRVSETSVRRFGEKKIFLELEIWRTGERTSKFIVSNPIYEMNHSLLLVVYALAMSN